jgi:hypothetical protein
LNEKTGTSNQNLKMSLLSFLLYLSETEFGIINAYKNLDLLRYFESFEFYFNNLILILFILVINLFRLVKALINQVDLATKKEFLGIQTKSLEIIQNFFLDKKYFLVV